MKSPKKSPCGTIKTPSRSKALRIEHCKPELYRASSAVEMSSYKRNFLQSEYIRNKQTNKQTNTTSYFILKTTVRNFEIIKLKFMIQMLQPPMAETESIDQ
jgi:hypothetical protein